MPITLDPMLAFNIFFIFFLFGFTIFIHELGHFLVAKWCGLKIDAFSLGFGKPLWKKEIDGVEYRLSVLPFGGYVALPQMVDVGTDRIEGTRRDDSLPPVSPWKKIAVAVAGPAFNILFALFLGLFVWTIGRASVPAEQDSVISWVEPGSEAEQKGVEVGDNVLSVQGVGRDKPRTVRNYEDFAIETMKHDAVTLITSNVFSGKKKAFELKTYREPYTNFGHKGIWSVMPRSLCRVDEVFPNTAAAKTRLQSKDILDRINGTNCLSTAHLSSLIKKNCNRPVTLTVRRDDDDSDKTWEIEMTPSTYIHTNDLGKVFTNDCGIGILFSGIGKDFEAERYHPNPVAQVWDGATRVFDVLGSLIRPREAKNVVQGLRGPVGIIDIYWQIKQSLMMIIIITVLINVNLAILNLLPFPILDGGHVMFSLYKIIFRRDFPPRLIEAIYVTCFVLIISAFLFLTWRDVNKWWERSSPPKPVPTQPAPVQPNSSP